MDVVANASFREVQYMRRWIWLVALICLVVIISAGMSGMNKPGMIASMRIPVFVAGLSTVLFLVSKLIVEVRDDGIYIKYSPFHMSYRKIPLSEIASVEARTYSPLREYGGWGCRGFGKNIAYNVSGNRGVQLVLRDGKRLLIGSQKPEELADAILLAKGR